MRHNEVRTRSRAGLVAAITTVAAFIGPTLVGAQTPKASPPPVVTTIRAMLDSSAAAWNRGDVKGHLATNADSVEFMTRHGPVVGNDSVVHMMTDHYFKNGQPTQQLRFEHVTVRPLGERHALAVGQFILSGGGLADQSGWFSTVWEHRPEGWRVIHDHSS
jgi:ketosteroid isomerase-like protein